MVWQCRLIDYKRDSSGASLQVGDMFYGPTAEEVAADDALPEEQRLGLWWPWAFCKPQQLSEYYRQHNSHRRPLLLYMPGRVLWCIDGLQRKKGEVIGAGWTVTGEAPNITMTPSIDMGALYHGYLTNGILSDDVAGVRYDRLGRIMQ